MKLEGKTALVTGAARIGRGIAEAFPEYVTGQSIHIDGGWIFK